MQSSAAWCVIQKLNAYPKKEKLHVARVITESFMEEGGAQLVLKSWRRKMVISRDNINRLGASGLHL